MVPGAHRLLALVGVAVLGAMIADYFWYMAGRRYGAKLLSLLCRVSLSPDSCIRRTESIYLRWGPPSLMVAKFIPGFASIASVLAGTVGTRRRSFLVFDSIGAAVWSASAVYLGFLFSSAVDELLAVLANLGIAGALLLAVALALYIGRKWWRRHRFMKALSMDRVNVDDLHEMLMSDARPVVIDVRTPLAHAQGHIPGAISLPIGELTSAKALASEIVVYCYCPNEVTAASVALRLIQSGYSRVRPLAGGIDAWAAAGYELET